MDGCMEVLEYYADIMKGGRALSEQQLADYKEKCAILQCMGEDASKYADFMLILIN